MKCSNKNTIVTAVAVLVVFVYFTKPKTSNYSCSSCALK